MGFEIIVEAVRREATKWQGMADEMVPVANAVDGLELGPLAFLVVSPSLMPGAEMFALAASYNGMRSTTGDQLRAASVEFDEIAGALIKCAVDYEKADKICELDLDKIYSK